MVGVGAKLKRFLRSEDGPTAVEYAVLLGLLAIVCITAVASVGTATATSLDSSSTQIGS